VVGKVEATALPHILQLVDAVGGELLLQLMPEIDKVGAEAEPSLLKVLDVGVEAGHPIAGIGDGIAVLQVAGRVHRGSGETRAKGGDNDRPEHTQDHTRPDLSWVTPHPLPEERRGASRIIFRSRGGRWQ